MKQETRKYLHLLIVFVLLVSVSVGYAFWIILTENGQASLNAIAPKINIVTDAALGNNVDPPSVSGDPTIYYGNSVTLTGGSNTIVYKNHEMTGTWAINTSVSTSSTTATNNVFSANYDLTFTPSGLAQLFYTSTTKIAISTYAVAKNTNTTTYYSTIDGALEKSANGNTIIVLTQGSGVAAAKDARTIGITGGEKPETTVPAGVTLRMPYDISNPDRVEYAENTYSAPVLTNLVFFKGKLINNGNLDIAAIVTGTQKTYTQYLTEKQTAATPTSIVSKSYAQLQSIDSNAIIESYGTLKCIGYIEGNVDVKAGSMTTLFTIYEHRGGSIFYGMTQAPENQQTFPVKRYNIQSVRGSITVHYGAKLDASVHLEISNQDYPDDFTLIGLAGAFFQLTDNTGYIVLEYDNNTKKNHLTTYGNAHINSISISITVFYVYPVTLSTQKTMIPLSYLWEIDLKPNGFTPATITLSSGNHIALLPGVRITVHENVTLDANNVAIYDSSAPLNYGIPAGCQYDIENKYGAGQLIIRGNFIADNFGGPILAGCAGATVQINSGYTITYYEPTSYTGSNLTTSVQHKDYLATLALPKAYDKNGTYSAIGTYYSAEAVGGGYAWYMPSTLNIQYSGASVLSKPHSGLYLGDVYKLTADDLPSVSKDHYTFDGWYFDSSFTSKASVGSTVSLSNASNTVTLYAKFTPINYTINYVYTGLSDVTYPAFPSGLPTTYNIESGNLSLPNATWEGTSYSFTGWYLDEACKSSANNAAFATIHPYYNNGTLTLYGEWTEVSYVLQFVTNQSDIEIEDATISNLKYDPEADSNIHNQITINDSNTSKSYYFRYWYTTDETTPYDPTTMTLTPDGNNTVTLYAKWGTKKSLTIAGDEHSGNNFNGSYYIHPNNIANQVATFDEKIVANDYELDVTHYFSGWKVNGTTTTLQAALASADTVTVTADWIAKYVIQFTDWNGNAIQTYYAMDGQPIDVPDALDRPDGFGKTSLTESTEIYHDYNFTNWGGLTAGSKVQASGSRDYPAVYEDVETRYHKISVQKWDATVQYTGDWLDSSGAKFTSDTVTANTASITYYANGTVTISITKWTYSGDRTFKINDVNQASPYTADASTINSIYIDSNPSCFAAGTLITLADGTQKPIEELKVGDMLLVWDFFEGKHTVAPASIIYNHGFDLYEILNLHFEDGTNIKTIYTHGFFDVDENRFVFPKTHNVDSYIGHKFMIQNPDGSFREVTLIGYSITEEYTESYSIISTGYSNCYANGILSVTPILNINHLEFFGSLVVGEGMKYDEETLKADIEKYGLFTYEELAEYMPYERFVESKAAYLKIMLGKGAITQEELIIILEFAAQCH